MNRNKHKFKLVYNKGNKKWSIFDNGTLYSDGYDSRKDAQDVIDEILGDDQVSRKEMAAFFTKWKNHIDRT